MHRTAVRVATSSACGEPPQWGRLVSRAAVCTMYLLFAYAHIASLERDGFRLSVALLGLFETVMVVLVFARRPTDEVDRSPLAVVAGLAGSFAALGLRPVAGGNELMVGEIVQVAGVLVQLGASLSLGRSFGLVPANRGVKTGGLYRWVRHPFYLAYLVNQLGYVASNPSAANGLVLLVGLGFQVVRIRYEERLLGRDPAYASYAGGVRWHLVPGVW
ncbi:MAG: isoprenylcysteine carboxyl methyltransferase [Acidimicrobiia bacterium]|nr:isoprenylcysteine carboxyl methyltransferase [Acidimicrobiia bacterium]